MEKKEKNTLIDVFYWLQEDNPSLAIAILTKRYPHLFKKWDAIAEEAYDRKYWWGAIVNNGNLAHRSCGGSDYTLSHQMNYKYYADEDLLQYGNNEVTIYHKGVWATLVKESEETLAD